MNTSTAADTRDTRLQAGIHTAPDSAAVVFNSAKSVGSLSAKFSFRNEAAKPEEPLEVLIYEDIGKSDWTGDGMDAKAFLAKLDGVPKTRALSLRVNSRGGDVFDGLAIYNRLNEWQGPVVGHVDGVAASIASVIVMAADEVRMPKSSQMFIHDAWGVSVGNAADMRQMADELDRTSDLMAGIYAARTGKTCEEMREMMRASKFMNGEEAKELGFCDAVTDGNAIYNFSTEDIESIKAMCRAGSQQHTVANHQNQKEPMKSDSLAPTVENKATDQPAQKQMKSDSLAPTVENKATDQPAQKQIEVVDILELRAEIDRVKAEAAARERRDRVARGVDRAVLEDRIPGAEREKWTALAMRDETVLELIASLPPNPVGTNPVSPRIEATASTMDICRGFEAFNEPTASFARGNSVATSVISRNAIAKAQFYAQHRDRIFAAAGDNTIPAGLQQQVILQESMRAFAATILPLRAFSTVFNNVPLLGTNIINVPYYDLQAAASTDWNAANGYVAGETVTATKAVTINKRKYQAMSATSSELARQPFLKIVELTKINAEKLGVDVFADVLSMVTFANYGAATITKTAALFDSDDVADLRGACNTANWPLVGRSLVLSPDYDTALTKDASVKSALAFGSNVAQTGQVPRLMGFDYYWTNNIPANAQNLVGFAVFSSAGIVATSPIAPAPMTRQGTVYEVIVDPATGISFEHRAFGDAQMDKDYDVIECNYGYVIGNASALKRIVSAA